MLGTIKSYDSNTFSGVISCESTGDEIEFSYPAVANKRAELHQGQRVSFYIEQGSQNNEKLVATKVTLIG